MRMTFFPLKTSKISDEAERRHLAACEKQEDAYEDPKTGFTVFTAVYLRRRGYCCKNQCRHCPYD